MDDVRDSAMSMSRHRDEVAVLALPTRRDLLRRISARQDRLGLESIFFQSVSDRLDVLAVALHLLRLTEVELVDTARRPAVGDVDQHDRRVVIACARQLPDVREDHLVVRRVLDGHEYALVHQLTDPRKNWSSSQMLSPAITNATKYASDFNQVGLTNSPIFALSDVKPTSGKTANESCMLRTTWLSTSSLAVPLSPYMIATIAAGTIAIARVMSRRSHGRIRRLRNPSITIWPASVPVSVEFCPEARSASANTMLAPPPRSGVRSL